MFKGLALFAQKMLDALVLVANAVAALFPPSPFVIIKHTGFEDLIAKINYFLPIYEFVSVLEAWLVAVAVWYAISVVARWIKAIE